MKKILNIAFIVVLLVGLTHCFEEENSDKESSNTEKFVLEYNGSAETAFLDPEHCNKLIKHLAETYKHARYEELGTSSDGTFTIAKLVISDNVTSEEEEPEVSIIGGVHGDEVAASYLPLKFAQFLCESYESNDTVKKIVNSYEIHIIPVLNPWGLDNKRRYNVNSVDLNRNFGWAWINDYDHGESAFDQKESQLVKDDALKQSYNLNIAFHSGATCISTVWDYIGLYESEGDPAKYDYDTFLTEYMPNAATVLGFADIYADSVVSAGDTWFYATEGYDWYSVYGSLGDWFYGDRGAIAYTIELSSEKGYTGYFTELDENEWYEALCSDTWKYHKDALIGLFSIFDKRIYGRVLDFDSGETVNAKISFVKESRSAKDPVKYVLFTYNDAEVGDFHMLCDDGSYTLTVEAEGYVTKSISGVKTGTNTGISIQLEKIK